MHAVLERLFDLPAAERTPAGGGRAGGAAVGRGWSRQEPALADAVRRPTPPTAPARRRRRPAARRRRPTPPAEAAAADACARPTTADPAGRPSWPAPAACSTATSRSRTRAAWSPPSARALISTLVDDELLIRGYIDRLDVSPAGDLRVVDYKTGGAPREAFEGRALFQLKFYALVLWRTRGVVPRVLRLLYLKDAEVCDYSPDAEELERFERTLVALSQAIETRQARPGLPAQAEPALRLVQPPGVLPRVRRHPAALPHDRGSPRRSPLVRVTRRPVGRRPRLPETRCDRQPDRCLGGAPPGRSGVLVADPAPMQRSGLRVARSPAPNRGPEAGPPAGRGGGRAGRPAAGGPTSRPPAVSPDRRRGARPAICEIVVAGETGDGAEAVELARRLLPDVLITELALPRLDGLRGRPGASPTPGCRCGCWS